MIPINWKQPSTQRGIAILAAGVLQILGNNDISVDSIQTAVGVLMAIAGAIGVLRGDPPVTPDTDRSKDDP